MLSQSLQQIQFQQGFQTGDLCHPYITPLTDHLSVGTGKEVLADFVAIIQMKAADVVAKAFLKHTPDTQVSTPAFLILYRRIDLQRSIY
ncbi:hypothetical protein D3C80_1588060 [compost metagenome]